MEIRTKQTDLVQSRSPSDDHYATAEREAIQSEGCELTVHVTAYDLLESLRSKGANFELSPRGLKVIELRLSDVDARLVKQHKVMLTRWALASWIEEQTGVEVEIAEWDGAALPDPEWFSSRSIVAYQVVPSNLGAPTPELEGFWALVFDHPPHLYRTPWRAAMGFMKAWKRHQATIRLYRRFGKPTVGRSGL